MNISNYQFNTMYRDSYSSLSRPVWSNIQIDDCVAYRLKNAVIPLSIPTFDSRNNIISITETTGSATTIGITAGFYDVSTLASSLENILNASSLNFTYDVTYSSLTNKLTINNTSGNFCFNSVANNSYYELGIESIGTYTTQQNMSSQIDISGVKCINLISNIGQNEIIGTNKKLLESIVCDESNLDVATYENHSGEYYQLDQTNIDTLYVQLEDERGRTITPNKDFTLSLSFQFE